MLELVSVRLTKTSRYVYSETYREVFVHDNRKFTKRAFYRLIIAIIVGLILQFGVISVPFLAKAFNVHNLSFRDWAIVAVFSLIPLFVNEIVKYIAKISKKEKV